MKSILYVGATLMIGASIYGFVDYKKSSQQKEFKGMYTEKKEFVQANTPEEIKAEPEIKEVIITKTKESVAPKKTIKKEEEIRGVKPIPADQKLKTSGKELKSLDEVTSVPAKENNEIKTKKKRKISTKLFSRAPLREDVEEENVITPQEKDVKKSKIKE